MLKVTYSGVVISQTGVVIIPFGMQRLAEIGLKSERRFGCLPCLFAQSDRVFKKPTEVAGRINDRQQRPGKSKIRIQPHRFSEIFLRA